MNQILNTQQQNAETLQKVSHLIADRLNTLATRQLEMAQKSVNEMVENAQVLTKTKSAEDYFKTHNSFVQKSSQQFQDNARELAELISATQTEAMTLLQKQFKDNWEVVAKQVQDAQAKATAKK